MYYNIICQKGKVANVKISQSAETRNDFSISGKNFENSNRNISNKEYLNDTTAGNISAKRQYIRSRR